MTATTISDTERREVTRRLRDWTWKSAPPECLLNQLAFGDDCPGIDDNPDTISCDECEVMAAERLADLIEPSEPKVTYVPERTCRVECYPPGYEDNLHYEVCSECGTILTASRPGDGHAARARYCPSCGARVVDE